MATYGGGLKLVAAVSAASAVNGTTLLTVPANQVFQGTISLSCSGSGLASITVDSHTIAYAATADTAVNIPIQVGPASAVAFFTSSGTFLGTVTGALYSN